MPHEWVFGTVISRHQQLNGGSGFPDYPDFGHSMGTPDNPLFWNHARQTGDYPRAETIYPALRLGAVGPFYEPS